MSSAEPVEYVTTDQFMPALPAPGAPPDQTNILKLVHRLLRGRYLIAVIAALIGAAAGGAAGYLSDEPKYKAEGMVRIQPVLPKILYDSEQSSVPPMFSSFVSTQATLLQSDRVLNKAMLSDAWLALRRSADPEHERRFRNSLSVVTPRDKPELIFVSFTDKEARASLIALQEVIAAYQNIYGGSEAKGFRELQTSTLNTRKKELEDGIKDFQTRIRTESAEFETSDLSRLHEHHFALLLELDNKLTALKTRLGELNIDPATAPDVPAGNTGALGAPPVLTPEQIAQVDRQMAQYFADRVTIERNITRLETEGVLDKHPDKIRAKADLIAINDAITKYAGKWNQENATRVIPPGASEVASPAQLLVEYRNLSKQADALRVRTEELNRKKQEIDGYKDEIEARKTKLAEVMQRLDEIGLESKVQDSIGRVEVIVPENPPSSPNVDPRKKYAAAGILLGGGLPLAIVALIGLLDRRMRYSDQAEEPTIPVPLLGILPNLPSRQGVPEQAAAAHCIHHIRTLLELSGAGRKVYVVSSPTAGDGKTSLALSLAMSFTTAGKRTALVDFDLVGQGLTTRFGTAPEHSIGQAMLSGSVNGCSMETPVPGLSLLAAARDDVGLVTRIPGENVRRVLDELRATYDVVLVDTGPVLGSLEATMAAVAADGIIVVVGRGQQRANVGASLERLTRVGARVVGLVFNRADSTDFNRSTASASIRSIREQDAGRALAVRADTGSARLGPLANSVALGSIATNPGDHPRSPKS